jgi:hypothetical protein
MSIDIIIGILTPVIIGVALLITIHKNKNKKNF